MNIKILETYDEISRAFDAFLELRPNLKDKENFVAQIIDQAKEGYKIIAIEENNEILACIGFRFLDNARLGQNPLY